MAKRKNKRRKHSRVLPTLLLTAALLLLVLGIFMVVRTMRGKTALPPETQEILYVITEPVTEPPATQPPTTEPTTVPTTEPTTEETTELPPGTVTSLSLSFYNAILYLGDEPITPVVYLEPADAENPAVFWTSTDESVASVDIDGTITAVGEGGCIIRAVSGSNTSLSAEVNVRVLPADAWTEPALSSPADWQEVDYGDPTRPDIQVIGGVTYV